MSAFNAATSWNLAHAITGNSPHYRIDYSQMMVSQGNLPAALNPALSALGTGKIEFTWEDNSSQKGAMPDDRAMLLIVDAENGKVEMIMEGNFRVSKSQVVTLPPHFEGMQVHGYIAFRNANQTMISDSRWAGEVEV